MPVDGALDGSCHLRGELPFIDEERVVEPGDLVHIPRNTRHGGRTIGEKSVFFVVKSPCGDGDLAQDYNAASDAAEVIDRLESKLDELSGEG